MKTLKVVAFVAAAAGLTGCAGINKETLLAELTKAKTQVDEVRGEVCSQTVTDKANNVYLLLNALIEQVQ